MNFELVLPGIWRMNMRKVGDLTRYRAYNYGWHLLSEIRLCVNGIFCGFGWPTQSKGELLNNFWLLRREGSFPWFDDNDELCFADAPDDAQLLAMELARVPSGWGLAVIDAAKRGVCRVGPETRVGSSSVVCGYSTGHRIKDRISVDDLIRKQGTGSYL